MDINAAPSAMAASHQTTDMVLQALLMAVWRRKPTTTALIHSPSRHLLRNYLSGNGPRFAVHQDRLGLVSQPAQSGTLHEPPGNCHDNVVAESFFNLLKRERIRRKVCKTRDEARQNVFKYIEMFYNPKRRPANNRMLSPVIFEQQQKLNP